MGAYSFDFVRLGADLPLITQSDGLLPKAPRSGTGVCCPNCCPLTAEWEYLSPVTTAGYDCKLLIRQAAPLELGFRKPMLYPTELRGHST